MATSSGPGEVLWDIPVQKGVSRWFLKLLGPVVIALGLLFIWAGVYTALNGGEKVILAIGLIGGLVLLGIGGWLLHTAFREVKLLRFRLRGFGVEITTSRANHFFRYAELQSIRYVEEDLAKQGRKKVLAAGVLAVSVLVAAPSGVGYAVGTMAATKIAGILYVKAPGLEEYSVGVPVDVATRLAPLLSKITVRE